MEHFELAAQLYESSRRLERAHCQIFLLNARLMELQKRYEKAVQVNRRSFRYGLRIKIVLLEGIINTYFEYASLKNRELKHLQRKLQERMPDHDYSTDSSDADPDDVFL
ncbi:hypothetical protein FSP39_011478 [Pinctada imbricata]|uniref:Uncharacterized protein n=1 Tax=Pinctada imbricata TaxID=66713 RepID=A0AA88Y462_PINIB|nr:hypothetical protein FSP39_011478 [Pinctada imbricata]